MDTQTEMQSQQQSGPTYLQKRPCAHGLHEVELPCDEKKPKKPNRNIDNLWFWVIDINIY